MKCFTYTNAGENEETAKKLFQRAFNSIQSHGSGVVRTALIDGGRALESAVKSLPGVIRRRYFAYCTRMGLTRGGGKRGGKGSLPRYVLDNGVKPKIMARMMSLVLLMLWLPSKLEYEQAMILFTKEFKEHINDHVAKTYLDPTHPENLGGRAAGMKAKFRNGSHTAICNGSCIRIIMRTQFRNDSYLDVYNNNHREISRCVTYCDLQWVSY